MLSDFPGGPQDAADPGSDDRNASHPRLEARSPRSGGLRAVPPEAIRQSLSCASHGWKAVFGVSSSSRPSGSRGAPLCERESLNSPLNEDLLVLLDEGPPAPA